MCCGCCLQADDASVALCTYRLLLLDVCFFIAVKAVAAATMLWTNLMRRCWENVIASAVQYTRMMVRCAVHPHGAAVVRITLMVL